jgi:type IV pilus assembly protein PilV
MRKGLSSSQQREESVSSDGAQGSRGFSLTEVLVAVICLAVGLLAIASLQMTSIRKGTRSQSLTQATYIAHDRLEFLKNLPFDSSQLRPSQYTDQNVTIQGVRFAGEYSVTEENTLKTIQYTVRWNDGRDHRVTFSTMRSQ